MKEYDREKYKLIAYTNERYSLQIESGEDVKYATTKVVYSKNFEDLYERGKKEAAKGNRASLYELKYEFIF